MSTENNRSEAQREQSRINGAHSQGPVTAEGKARSSQNNLHHGLRTTRIVLANESQPKYDALLASYTTILNPVGQIEYDVVVHIVNAQWRLRRIHAMETAIIDAEMFIHFETVNAAFQPMTPEHRQAEGIMALAVGNPTGLEYFERAEARISRIYDRSMKTLIRLQTIRTGSVPVFNFENETSEPGKDQSNCEENENFSHFWRFVRPQAQPENDRRHWKDPAHHPPASPEPKVA